MDQKEWFRKNKLPLYIAAVEKETKCMQLNDLMQTKKRLLAEYRELERRFTKESQCLMESICTISQLIDDINKQMYNKSKKEIL